jgi:hypothetical protein
MESVKNRPARVVVCAGTFRSSTSQTAPNGALRRSAEPRIRLSPPAFGSTTTFEFKSPGDFDHTARIEITGDDAAPRAAHSPRIARPDRWGIGYG